MGKSSVNNPDIFIVAAKGHSYRPIPFGTIKYLQGDLEQVLSRDTEPCDSRVIYACVGLQGTIEHYTVISHKKVNETWQSLPDRLYYPKDWRNE